MQNDRYALLVIDMQLVAFDGKITPPIVHGSQVLDSTAELIDISRANGIPVVYLQTCALSGMPYAKDVHGWEIHPRLSPAAADRVVYKVQSNGFEDTELQEVLTQIGVDALITCGIWSEYCVTATSKAALELGYRVCVATDAHGTVADSEDNAREIVTRQNNELVQCGALSLDVKSIATELIGT